MIGESMPARKAKRPMAKPQRNADQRRQTKADTNAAQRVQDVPADAHVVRAVVIERIGEQLQGRQPGAQRARQALALGRNRGPHADKQHDA